MPSLLAQCFRSSRRAPLVVTFATIALALASACGDAPPPPAKATPIRNVRVHVANGSRFDICRVEACGQPGRAVDRGATPNDPPLKPRTAGLYEIRECKTGPLVAIACPDAQSPLPPCLKAEGGAVQDGTMFRIAPCAL